jgi:glyoxylase-like metal-dependent hydrolase (beta-lactamase superfamily II)
MLGFGRVNGKRAASLTCAPVGRKSDGDGCGCCGGFALSRRGFLAGASALAAVAVGGGDVGAQTAAPVREITRIAGDLWRFRNNNHYSVFLVTPAGIVATDPINADAAQWLKAQFKERFNQTAKYLVYSHDHADHISGGEVFADTAVIVAHENAHAVIVGEKRPTPPPQVTFAEGMRIELGGAVVDLHYVGRNHSDNSLVLRVPAARTAFAVDFIPIKSLPFRTLPDAYLGEWLASLRRVEALDFDVLAPGHGGLGTRADVAAFRGYMEELHAAVLAGARAGKQLAELQASILMEKYKDWGGYAEMRPLNIEGMYRLVQANRRDNRGGSGPVPG